MSNLIQKTYPLAPQKQIYRIIDYFLEKNLPNELLVLLDKLIIQNKEQVTTKHFHPIIEHHAEKKTVESKGLYWML